MAGQLLDEIKNMGRYRRLSPERLKQLAEVATRLRTIDLFDSLTNEQVAHIAERGRIVKYLAGDLVIRKGDTDQTFYVIVSGQVRVWDKQADGMVRLLNYHTTGDFFGELAILNDTPRSANVDVVSELIRMIMAQRAYEVNSRAIKAGDEMLSVSSRLGS